MNSCLSYISTTCFLLLLSAALYSQERYRLVGTVVDSTQMPVVEAVVVVDGGSYTDVTDAAGRFDFTLPASRTYEVTVMGINIVSAPQTIVLDEDTSVDILVGLQSKELPSVLIRSSSDRMGIRTLRATENGGIYEGKKTEVINIERLVANKATNNARQAYSRIPSLNVWESDQAGLQLDIGGRGLSPKRTTNFNTRQNGYDISADPLGYPESYYTPPLQAVQQIEVVRGAAALQYGTQFGGLINFKIKKGATDRPMTLQSSQSFGAFGLFNSFNEVHGQVGKLNYYTYGQYKRGDGWRDNSAFEQVGAHVGLQYQATSNLRLDLDYTHMDYLSQQAGGLTDEAFLSDPRMSNRQRNYFQVNWNMAALSVQYAPSPGIKVYSRTFGLLAGRTSLGLLETPDRSDPGGNRDLIDGSFANIGNETRVVLDVPSKQVLDHTLLLGSRLYRGRTNFVQGFGDNSTEANFSPVDTAFLDRRRSNFTFPNFNAAVFAEMILRVGKHTSLIPGLRYEHIDTRSEGQFISTLRTNAFGDFVEQVNADTSARRRGVFLYGLGLSHKLSDDYELYGNATANYRAINFTDVQIQTNTQVVDPNIRDEKGYSFDIGVRRRGFDPFYVEAGLFYIHYGNRIGELIDDGLRLRTNIGSATIVGFEIFAEVDIMKVLARETDHILTCFVNGSINRGVYRDISRRALVGVRAGNTLEDIPRYNVKTGVTYGFADRLAMSLQGSFVGRQYSDAANTEQPFIGVFGPIPSYQVFDLSMRYHVSKRLTIGASINNLLNQSFFTRRALAYPGPGIIPAMPRSWALTLKVNV